ncbi:MAG: DsbA family protein [Chloroflexi bacterium]|nr:DsbA family protein [Chloroflexota bacterium]
MLAEYCAQNPGNCVAEGADNAQITIVEVSDYGCGHCKNFNLDTAGALKAQYVDGGQVRWVVMPYALGGTGSGFPTAPSANAAMCANEQGAFPQFHTALFANQSTSAFNNEAGFLATAESLNLDLAAFQECVENGRFNDTVLQNIQTANQAGINSTPSFFVNGELVRGNVPLANFQQIIDAQLGS